MALEFYHFLHIKSQLHLLRKRLAVCKYKVTNFKDYQHFNPFSLSWIIFFSSFVALEELAIPKCMTDLKDKKAQKGGKTFFTMKIRGEPIPEVAW